jgi:hypothetical protein
MSEVRLTVADADSAIHGEIHGSVADAVVGALCAEPETIEELECALGRFIKPNGYGHFAGFRAGPADEPWDAGIVLVDLAARVVAAESTYSIPSQSGQVRYHDGTQATDVRLPYRVPDDWIFLGSIAEYRDIAGRRRSKRMADQPLDARPVLYGAVTDFIVKACLAARDSNMQDPVPQIHACWLTTPREDLGGRSPRDVVLEKWELVDYDLASREMKWSFLGEAAPCLSPESRAYRYAGFGTHEIVLYYKLLRLLLSECWSRVSEANDISPADEAARLERIKAQWLECPQSELDGFSPAGILECERKRLPLRVSPEVVYGDDHCPVCRAMLEGRRPTFMHLDGINMDDEFTFSFCRTREEWDEEDRRRRKIEEEFRRERKRRKRESRGSRSRVKANVVH